MTMILRSYICDMVAFKLNYYIPQMISSYIYVTETLRRNSKKLLLMLDQDPARNYKEICVNKFSNSVVRSSRPEVFCKKVFLKISQILQESNCVNPIFNEVEGLEACNFTKKRLQHRCCPVNIAKFLRTLILKNICKRLLLCQQNIVVYDNKR